jgi:hypothetical protein
VSRAASYARVRTSGLFFALGVAALIVAADPLRAQERDPYYNGEPGGESTTIERGDDRGLGTRNPGSLSDESGSTLPFSGGDLALFAVTGAAAIATGTVALHATRGRPRQAAGGTLSGPHSADDQTRETFNTGSVP